MFVSDIFSIGDYDVQIDAEYYNTDYDLVELKNQSEQSEKPQSDILFE